MFQSLPTEKLRVYLGITLTSTDNTVSKLSLSSPRLEISTDAKPQGDTLTEMGQRPSDWTSKRVLETTLGRLKFYYSKVDRYPGDFEDDFENALAELQTASSGLLAPDYAKP